MHKSVLSVHISDCTRCECQYVYSVAVDCFDVSRRTAMKAVVCLSVLGFALLCCTASADNCAAQTNCVDCVAEPLCGWCSVPVEYQDNSTGPQCAGYGAGSRPFICNAVYSTEVCQRGYLCDTGSGSCQLGPAGSGETLAECEAICHKTANNVYLCDTTTKECNQVPAGTPGSTSLQICQAVCSGSATPVPGPAAKTYACNISDWTCSPTTPGHGASQLVCEQECNANNSLFVCNYQDGSCVSVPPLTPNGVNLTTCQAQCSGITPAPIPPSPGPPPEYIGIWRGIEIQNNYSILEWDIMINISTAIFTVSSQSTRVTFSGTPYHIPNSPDLEMWIEVHSGPGANLTVRTIGDTSGAMGPETSFATMAMGYAGGPTPASLTAAMTDGKSKVMALAKCIVNEDFCSFIMPTSTGVSATQRRSAVEQSQIKSQFVDACSAYDADCTTCLAQPNCGWCSVPVTYSDGQTGTQCAGGQTGSTPFVCPGHYSTLSCEVGYICTSTLDCVATVPGDGMPLPVCQATCVATPPPAPTLVQYTCNLNTSQCAICSSPPCPGSMPLVQCNELCPHPYPGPTPALLGVWRGIYIQQRYSIGEVDFVFNETGCTVYKDGVFFFHATIISLGSDVMLFTIDEGSNKGSTFGTLYQMAREDFGMYTQMTLAIGKFGGGFPADFNTPMFTTGMQEVVLAQCAKAPCNFNLF